MRFYFVLIVLLALLSGVAVEAQTYENTYASYRCRVNITAWNGNKLWADHCRSGNYMELFSIVDGKDKNEGKRNTYGSTTVYSFDFYIFPKESQVVTFYTNAKRTYGNKCRKGGGGNGPKVSINLPYSSNYYIGEGTEFMVTGFCSSATITIHPYNIQIFNQAGYAQGGQLSDMTKVTYKVNRNLASASFKWYYKVGLYGSPTRFPASLCNRTGSSITFCGNDIEPTFLQALNSRQNLYIYAESDWGGVRSSQVGLQPMLEAPRINKSGLVATNPACAGEGMGQIKIPFLRALYSGEKLDVYIEGKNEVTLKTYYDRKVLSQEETYVMFSNVPAGKYVVKYNQGYDAAGNPYYVYNSDHHTATFTLTDPPVLTFSSQGSVAVHCYGGRDGKIRFTAGGGTGNLYALCNGSNIAAIRNGQTEIPGLYAGEHQVRLRDGKGCFLRDGAGNERVWGFTVGQPAGPVTVQQQSVAEPTGYGRSDGEIWVVANGGSQSDYIYSWEKEGSLMPGSTAGKNGLGAGTYRIWVKDGNYGQAFPQTEENLAGCRGSVDIPLGQPPLLTAAVQLDRGVSCNGYSDGGLSVVAGGGVGGYEYQWQVMYGGGWVDKTERSAANGVVAGLKADVYRVLVWDRNHNYAESAAFQLTEPAPYAVRFALTEPLCQGGTDGRVEAVVSGSNGGYTYRWQGMPGAGPVVGGGAGRYILTVSDVKGCQATQEVALGEPVALQALYTINKPSSDGAADGSIYVTASGGTPGYSYEWSKGGATSNPLTGVRTDSVPYFVVVRDAHGCSVGLSPRVVYPLEADVRVKREVSCHGAQDGLLEAFPEWGISRHYRYQWYKIVNGSTVVLAGNGKVSPPVGAGSYRVRVTDTENHSVTKDIVLTEPAALTAELQVELPSSAGASDGRITVVATGGTPGYAYQWNYMNSTDNPLAGIAADSVPYRVTVRDGHGCEVVLSEQVLYPLGVSLAVSRPVSCKGKADGVLEALAEGGQSRYYRYEWYQLAGGRWNQLSGTGKVLPALGKGSYQVKVWDTKGSTAIATVELTEPELLTAGYELFPPSSAVASDGKILVVPSGGTPGYTYEWEYHGASDNPLTGIPARNIPYRVTVKDAHLCEVKLQPVLLFPLQVKIEVSRPVSCHGMTDACLVATAVGGVTDDYRYEWLKQVDGVWASLVRGQDSISGVGPARYRVVVTDGNDSTAMSEWVLTEPDLLTAVSDTVCPSSALASDGEILIRPSGGTPYDDGSYRYEWDYGHSVANPLTGIAADSVPYHVVVRDARGCETELSPRLIYPLGVSVRVRDSVSCYGVADGALEAFAEGGVSRLYTWQWYRKTDEGFKAVACREQLVRGLLAGEYRVKVWDSERNEVFSEVLRLGEPDTLTVGLLRYDPACYHGSDGWLEASVAGGTLPYAYRWEGNDGESLPRREGLSAGAYELQVTDRRGCEAVVRDTLTEPDSLVVGHEVLFASAAGEADGMIRLKVSGGTLPYAYLWDYDGSGNGYLDGVGASDTPYRVTVTDSHGCTAVDTPRIYNRLTVFVEVRDSVSCYGRKDGRLAAVVAGGTGGPYRFEWLMEREDGMQTPEGWGDVLQHVGEGVYRVKVWDRMDSVAVSDVFTFLQPDRLELQLVCGHPGCYGDRNGWVSAVTTGGMKPYRYLWSGRTEGTADRWNGLGEGRYELTVTDRRGCVVEGSAELVQPDRLTVSHEVRLPSVYGGNDGVIQLMAAGGTAPYAYAWDDPLTGANPLTGLSARERLFRAEITDAHGCRTSDSVRMYEPVTIELEESGVIVCSGDGNAELTGHVRGGAGAPYRYEWYGVDGEWTGRLPGKDSVLTGVTVGVYRLAAVDAEGNRGWSADHAVVSPDSLRLDFRVGDLLCKYDGDGWIEAFPAGGEGPYRMEWMRGDTLRRIEGLEEGFYEVKMTDRRGCFVVRRPQVKAPDELQLSMGFREPLAWEGEDGMVWVTVQGGRLPYRYSWKGHAGDTDTLWNVAAGDYEVTVTDANRCHGNGSVVVTQPSLLKVGISLVREPLCYGRADGELVAHAVGGRGSGYRYDWFRIGGQDAVWLSCGERSAGLGAGVYRVRVTDGNEVVAWSADYVLREPEALQVLVGMEAVSCSGGRNGKAEAQVRGGIAPYRYVWTCGDRTSVAEGLAAGRYLVMVTDAHQCRAEAVGEVGSPEKLVIASEVREPVCKGDAGEISLTVAGGVRPYMIRWEDGFSGGQRDGLRAGSYAVMVTDEQGCESREEFVLEEPEEVTVDLGEELFLCRHQKRELRVVGRQEIAGYSWWCEGKCVGSSPVLTVSSGGLYRVDVVTGKGCPGSGEVKVTQNNTEISCNFAMASEVEEGNSLKIVNTSLPMPEYCEWIVPESSFVMVEDEQDDLLELIIGQTGVYTVGLRSESGGCEESLYKEVTVVPQGEGRPATRAAERLISDIRVWPNPNDGNFRVRVALEKKAGGLLRLYASTGVLLRELKCEGSDAYEFAFSESLPVGIYILHVIFGREREAVKVAIE